MSRSLNIACQLALLALVFGACSSAKNGGFSDDRLDAGSERGSEAAAVDDFLDAMLGGDTALATDGGLGDGSLFSDGAPDVVGSDACVSGDAGPAPYTQRCSAGTTNECNGVADTALTQLGVGAPLLNGSTGNGYDDDCDGLVDEGCTCPGAGNTKDCFLLPATQANPSTKTPVGWCTDNSKGSLDCAGTEFPKWSGICRGAQPPYRHDVCAIGDFNCDGVQQNSDVADCSCKVDVVQCPTTPLTLAPYPDPKSIPIVDGSLWIQNAGARAQTTNWTWTVVGGDCDNVLPHPTFAIYSGADSTAANARKGGRQPVKYDANANPARHVATGGEPLVAIQALSYGNGIAGGQVYPAFGLSGDYIVQGEWDLNGTHYVCSQKVQVRAPGIRAELCWDTVGGDPLFVGQGNDIDLHFARLQGVSCTGGTQGWDSTCASGISYQDCWYANASGCRDGSSSPPGWGYSNSLDSACIGWSSKRSAAGTQKCTNPRLDKDNVTCDRSVDDPTYPGNFLGIGGFCGPENINLDNPKDNDAFVVGVNHYGNTAGTENAKPHVNLYCNGVRVLSAGYNPVTGQTSYPVLTKHGTDRTGDFWTVATIRAHVDTNGQLTSCDVATIPSHHADPTRDGPAAQLPPNDTTGVCIDSTSSQSSTPYNYVNHQFIENAALQGGVNGGLPAAAIDWCKH